MLNLIVILHDKRLISSEENNNERVKMSIERGCFKGFIVGLPRKCPLSHTKLNRVYITSTPNL